MWVASDSPLFATGDFTPDRWLQNGGEAINLSPEFYWSLELKRLAADYHPPEKRVESPEQESKSDSDDPQAKAAPKKLDPSDWEIVDYEQALKSGEIKPGDVEKAKKQQVDAREFLDALVEGHASEMPEEFPSEFADYHRGVLAYRTGNWKPAADAWEALLKRPEAERHFRTVAAAFMLGKAALKLKDPEAVKWFRKTRELAKAGFVDTTGLAADSYGWEGRAELRQGHQATAAALYLTQLALGDEGAIVSLKAVIPDRAPIEGMLNYGPEPEDFEKMTPEQREAWDRQELEKLKAAVQDPLLRRLVTVHILAAESRPDIFSDTTDYSVARETRWLKLIEETKPTKLEDAEYLGWVAYNAARYSDATRWLKVAGEGTPAALWLKSKLQWRAGEVEKAAATMAEAWKAFHSHEIYSEDKDEYGDPELFHPFSSHRSFLGSAGGDLAGLFLNRGEFVSALDIFLKGNLWYDAALVAERVLTIEELQGYVKQMPVTKRSEEPSKEEEEGYLPSTSDPTARLRWLLGRRLVRNDRCDEAIEYLPKRYQKSLTEYARGLKNGANDKLPKMERAKGWFDAAVIAREEGMEIMGTEVEPDGFVNEGNFPMDDIAAERLEGKTTTTTYDAKGEEKKQTGPLILKASAKEKERLKKNRVNPETRFHYRMIAAALAFKAAQLLPNNSEELADVLNTAGNWTKNRDEKAADRYYQAIEKRCPNTEIGKAVIKNHWFVDMTGVWSGSDEPGKPTDDATNAPQQ